MQLTLKRSGGFLGAPLPPVTLETGSLPPAKRTRLESLVSAAAFFTLPATLVAKDAQRDRFQFTLEITDDSGAVHKVTFDEQAAPESLMELVQAIKAAVPRKG